MHNNKVPWLILAAVFMSSNYIQSGLFSSATNTITRTQVLGQGHTNVTESSLANITSMPLVSVGVEISDTPGNIPQGIDESLFYSVTAKAAEVVEMPVQAPVIKTPEFIVANEVRASVRVNAIVGSGAIINSQFFNAGDAVARVRNRSGEPVIARLSAVHADYVVISAAGELVRVGL